MTRSTPPWTNRVLDGFVPSERPAAVRGGGDFGNEPFIEELGRRGQSYLFALRPTKGVRRLLRRRFARQDWTEPPAAIRA